MTGRCVRVARALLTWAVRGRGERGTDWGESMLREMDETNGGWESVRWAVSGLRVARRDRLRHLPQSRPLGGLPPTTRFAVRALAVVVAGVATLAMVNQYILSLAYMPGGGMAPTLSIGDHYLLDRVAFRLTGLDYGDVVAIRMPAPGATGGEFETTKRVLGLPGDRITCVDGQLVRNGDRLAETYLRPGAATECDPVTVPADWVYVLGDDRDVSLDSRHWGTVPLSAVTGRELTRLWNGPPWVSVPPTASSPA